MGLANALGYTQGDSGPANAGCRGDGGVYGSGSPACAVTCGARAGVDLDEYASEEGTRCVEQCRRALHW